MYAHKPQTTKVLKANTDHAIDEIQFDLCATESWKAYQNNENLKFRTPLREAVVDISAFIHIKSPQSNM